MVLTLKKVNKGTRWVEVIRLYFRTLENVDHYIEKCIMERDVRLGLVLWWRLFFGQI